MRELKGRKERLETKEIAIKLVGVIIYTTYAF